VGGRVGWCAGGRGWDGGGGGGGWVGGWVWGGGGGKLVGLLFHPFASRGYICSTKPHFSNDARGPENIGSGDHTIKRAEGQRTRGP
jgi:hypothetical protein